MSYLVLARKYRPQKFADLTGQETIAKILQSAILQNRVAHAYLFSGPRGIGKTTTARIFAKAINCEKRKETAGLAKGTTVEPCNECTSCEEIAKGSAMDVLELDAASHTQVEKIREVIIDSVAFAPAHSRYKIFIIDEVHMLSNHSFNALLKTLEEPPAHVVFILATTDFHKIPTTIASRCQRFRFRPLVPAEIKAQLVKIAGIEKIPIEDHALALLSKAAGGAMRDGLSLFDQVISSFSSESGKKGGRIERKQVEDILGVVSEDFMIDFLGKIADKDAKSVLAKTRQALEEGYDLSYFLKELREDFREMLIAKCGFTPEGEENRSAHLPVQRFSREELLRACQVLTRCAEQMRGSDLPDLIFETHLVRLCQDVLTAEQVLGKNDELEGKTPPSRTLPVPQAQNKNPGIGFVKTAEPPAMKATAAQSNAEETAASAAAEPELVHQSLEVELHSAEGAVVEISPQLQSAWPKVLEELHHSKPSLYAILQTAQIQWLSDRIEMTFSKSFGLDSAKRNSALIEQLLNKLTRRKISIAMKLGPVTAGQDVLTSDGVETEDVVVEDAAEESGNGESFEVIGSGEGGTPESAASEDEGVKRFLELFPGKITSVNNPS